jgi:hypothetical protein
VDKYDWRFKQSVTEAEMDQAFDWVEEAQQNFFVDLESDGVFNGMLVTETSPTTLSVDVSFGVGYDDIGRRVLLASGDTVDVSADSNGLPTEPSGGSNERWVSLFIRFVRDEQTPLLDGSDPPQLIYTQLFESAEFVVRMGIEAPVGTAPRPSLVANEILLCDIYRLPGQAVILDANIDVTRRQTVSFFSADRVPVDTSGFTVLTAPAGDDTVQGVFDDLDTILSEHFAGTSNRHDSADVDFNGTAPFWPGSDVETVIEEAYTDFQYHVTANSGASRIHNAQDIAYEEATIAASGSITTPAGSLIFAPATGSIVNGGGSTIVDGEVFVLDDGVNPAVTFEFDDDSSVVETGTLRQVAFTGGESATAMTALIDAAITGAPTLDISVSSSGGNTVNLVNDTTGVGGNVAITETVVDGSFVVSGMSGGTDSETFVLDDGVNAAVTFEFDDNSSVVESATLRAVTFSTSDTANQVRDAIVTAINNAPTLDITPTPLGGGVVLLVNDELGLHGNIEITSTLVDSGWATSGMSGGENDYLVEPIVANNVRDSIKDLDQHLGRFLGIQNQADTGPLKLYESIDVVDVGTPFFVISGTTTPDRLDYSNIINYWSGAEVHPVVTDGERVYYSTSFGIVAARYDSLDTPLWVYTPSGSLGVALSMAADGLKVYATYNTGETFALDPSDGNEDHSVTFAQAPGGNMCDANGTVFVTYTGATGRDLWIGQTSLTAGPYPGGVAAAWGAAGAMRAICISNDRLFAVGLDSGAAHIQAFDLTGTVIWQYRLSTTGAVPTDVRTDGNYVYASFESTTDYTVNMSIICLSANDGALVWRAHPGTDDAEAIAVDHEVLVAMVPSGANRDVFMLDKRTGHSIGELSSSGSDNLRSLCADGVRFFAGGWNGDNLIRTYERGVQSTLFTKVNANVNRRPFFNLALPSSRSM